MNIDRNNSQVEAIVASWYNSGMTQVEYAKSNNLSIHSLRYWLYKRKKSTQNNSAGFVQLKDIFREQEIVLRYPNGVELSIPAQTSLTALKVLINL